MIKFGITSLEAIKSPRAFKSLFGKDKKISIALYKDITAHPNQDMLAEQILLQFADERGAYKRTYKKRFETFDQKVLSFLKKYLRSSDTLSFHDVAVSDGRTALDFFEKIAAQFSDIDYLASDYNPSVIMIKRGNTHVTLSKNGKVLEILFPPFVFNTIKKENPLYYPLNRVIHFIVDLFLARPLVKAYMACEEEGEEIFLFSPKVLECAKSDTRFHLGQHDLLSPFIKNHNIIRAMNVLNASYFSKEEFERVIKNLYNGLIEGGFLIAGSNQEAGSVVNGGIYKKTSSGFERVLVSGDGLPSEKFILS